jgi:hypothetical protein
MNLKEELGLWIKGKSKFNFATSIIALAAGLYLLGSDGDDGIHLVGFVVAIISGLDLVQRLRERKGD